MNDHSFPRPVGALLALALIAGCGQRSSEDRSAAARASTAVVQEQGAANASTPSNDPGLVADAKRSAERVVSNGKEIAGRPGDAPNPSAGNPNPAEPMNDAAITASVKAMLAADPQLAALMIGVDTRAGVVTLTGRAPDAKTVDRVVEVAANAKGVLRVENQLTAPGKS